MKITIEDGADVQTITTGPAIDAALQARVTRYNTENSTTLTKAQYLKARFVELGQEYKRQTDADREAALLAKFIAATEAKKAAAEAAVS